MKYRAVVPFSDKWLKIGRVGTNYNDYWVRAYQWNDSLGKYESRILSQFTSRKEATKYFRSVQISLETPRVEIWGTVKGKMRFFTYKGLK